MDLKIDHIVHFIKHHPEEAVKEWKKLGYHAVMGGSHTQWGTFNSLLYIGLSYIEYLAIEDIHIASQSENPLISQIVSDLHHGEGFAQICFRTSDIFRVKEQLEKKGCKTFPVFNGSRKRQDGSTIHWKMLFINEKQALPYPFFIEWEEADANRFKDLKLLNMIDQNLENHQIQALFIATNDCEKTAKEWSRLLELPIIPPSVDSLYTSKKTGVRIDMMDIIFFEPMSKDGIVYETLKSKGERPFLVQIHPPLKNEPITLFSSIYH